MSPFVESIRFLNGKHYNLAFHQARFDFTRDTHYPGTKKISLGERLVPPGGLLKDQLYKCRVIYGEEIQEVTYEPYSYRNIIQYHLVVCPDEFDYTFKLTNRSFFDEARKRLGPTEDFIYIKKGLITDTSFANLVFTDGKEYVTPSTPLLKGTRRAYYLSEGLIREEELSVKDITRFKSFFTINAMADLEPSAANSCDKLLLSHIQLKLC